MTNNVSNAEKDITLRKSTTNIQENAKNVTKHTTAYHVNNRHSNVPVVSRIMNC